MSLLHAWLAYLYCGSLLPLTSTPTYIITRDIGVKLSKMVVGNSFHWRAHQVDYLVYSTMHYSSIEYFKTILIAHNIIIYVRPLLQIHSHIKLTALMCAIGDTFHRAAPTGHTINWCCSKSDVANPKELPSKTTVLF